MKKIILALIILFCTCGCYDYVEINDLSFITSIGIDYQDNNYELTFEIINDSPKGESKTIESYTLSDKGPTLSQAFANTSLKISKIPFYDHLKVLVISEEVAKNHMEEVINYIIRNTKIRTECLLTIAKDVPAKEILNVKDEGIPVIATKIEKMIDSNKFEYSTAYTKTLEDCLARFVNDKIDAITTTLSLKEDKIVISGLSIFQNYAYYTTLDDFNSAILNILNEEDNNLLITKNYNDKLFTIKLYDSKIKYEIQKDKINIIVSIEGQIVDNLTDLDLRKVDTYKMLNKDFSSEVESQFKNLIQTLQEQDLDPLGIANKYYKKYKTDISQNLKQYPINVSVKVNVNRNGLIFEVENE